MVTKPKKVVNSVSPQDKSKTYFTKSNPKSVSRTRQSFRDECNINNIMDKVNRHMIMPTGKRGIAPAYVDCSDVPSYSDALNQTIKVKNSFNALPARVRARFENDPQQLLDFMNDSKNVEEARDLGLAPKDMSNVKYVDAEGNDITDAVLKKASIVRVSA